MKVKEGMNNNLQSAPKAEEEVKSNFYNINPDIEQVKETKADKAEWVGLEQGLLLNNSIAMGTYEIDLSDILPKDKNQYEIIIAGAHNSTGAGKNTILSIESDILPLATAAASDPKTTMQQYHTTVPIGVERKLIKRIHENNAAYSPLIFLGYRKVN